MAKPLVVWGVVLMSNRFGKSQVRAIVAARSRAAAGRAFQLTDSYLRDYGSETGNQMEIEIARREPGTVFIAPLDGTDGQKFERR